MSARPDFSTRPVAQPLRALDVALAGLAGVLLLWSGGAAVAARSEAARGREVVGALREELRAARGSLDALSSRRRSGPQKLAPQMLLTSAAPPQRVLAELGALLPPDVRLESLTLSYGARLELEAALSARHAAAYDRLLERLQESPLFEDVLPGGEERSGEMRATIRMAYRGRER